MNVLALMRSEWVKARAGSRAGDRAGIMKQNEGRLSEVWKSLNDFSSADDYEK